MDITRYMVITIANTALNNFQWKEASLISYKLIWMDSPLCKAVTVVSWLVCYFKIQLEAKNSRTILGSFQS